MLSEPGTEVRRGQAERRRGGVLSASAHGPTRTRPGRRQTARRRCDGSPHDTAGSDAEQGVGRGPQRGPGGDDVVDDEHPPIAPVGMADERRTGQPPVAAKTGLRAGAGRSLEQPARRQPQLAGDLAGDQFGLIEPAPAPASRARRRPGHDIDVAAGSNPFGDEAVDEQAGEVTRELAAVAVLEPEDDVADAPGERHGGDDPALGPAEGGAWRRTGEGEAAGTAQGHTQLGHNRHNGTGGACPRCTQGV